MSLINKVLRDLEAQRESASERRARSPLADESLRPVRPVKPKVSRAQLIRIGLVLAIVAVGAFAWIQWGAKLLGRTSAPPAAVTPPAKVAAAPAAAPKAITPPAPVAAPVVKADAPKLPPADAGKPATPPAKPLQDVVVRKPKPEPAKPEKSAAAAVPGAPTETVTAKAKDPAPEDVLPIDDTEAQPEKPKPAPDPAVEKPVGKAVLEKKVKSLSPPEKAENEFRLAAARLQQQRAGEAEAHLRAALAAQSSHVKARELLAGLLLQSGRWREAQSLLEQGVSKNPTHYPFAQLLARSYVDHGQEKRALDLLERSREAAGGDAEYFAFVATLYQRTGRHGDAVKAFNDAVKLRPQEGRWWLGLAISLEATEQWTSARDAYQRAAASGLDRQLLQYTQQRIAALRNK